MLTVKASAKPRAGLLGNPSDMYGGRGIAFTFDDFGAEVTLTPAAKVDEGHDLVRAANAVFVRHAVGVGVERARLDARPFAAQFASDIPRGVGLAGSSAIVVAALRALAKWHDVAIPPLRLAELALAAEVDVLGIRGGPMDRLAQAFEGVMAMDFAAPFEPGSVERLDADALPPLLIAWDDAPKASSGLVHVPVWERYQAGDPQVRAVMAEYRPLVERGRAALARGDFAALRALVDRNFDLRASLFPIRPRDRRMIDLGRERGAATKFCGSGGAVLVVPEAREAMAALHADYRAEGFATFEPTVSRTMHAIVLAAGFATRLHPLTLNVAKPLLDVGGRAILTRVVDSLVASRGVHAITVVANRRFHGDFVRWADAMRAAGVEVPIEVLDDGAESPATALGAVRDLRFALAQTKFAPGAGYLVAGGDNVLGFDLAPFVTRFVRERRPLLPLRRVTGPVPPRTYAEAQIDADSTLVRLREKPADPQTPFAAICLYLVPVALPEWLDAYLAGGGNPDAPGHFFAWLVARERSLGVPFDGAWFDIGTPETLATARRLWEGK